MTSTIKVNTVTTESGSTLTLGGCGKTVALASGASQTGFGRTGTVNWQTAIKTSTFTAASGEGYFIDTNSGGFTVNLPAGSAGDIVAFKDYRNTFDTGPLLVAPNGTDKIGGVNASVTFSTESQSVTLIFTDSTRGWLDIHDSTTAATGNNFIVATGGTETTSGDDKIHTFTGPGTFTVTATSPCAANYVGSYLVIGGGGGGQVTRGGGGGAGGFRELKSPSTPYTASPLDGYPSAPNRVTVTATAFPITVGGGGSGGAVPATSSVNGANSTFSTITAAGGGRGGGPVGTSPSTLAGGDGGSGGGAYNPGSAVGAGNTPPTTPAQGNDGGSGAGAPKYGAGGGGGAGAVGTNGSTSAGGNGGTGVSTEITASAVTRAGGGGGGAYNTSSVGSGGSGGGGDASPGSGTPYVGGNGTDNTGGGGGGNSNLTPGAPGPCGAGGNGGSGIVVIRYKIQ